ncbi:MAG: enoyl-CoA hydratase-related protein [Betaproteobacteria bacterium]
MEHETIEYRKEAPVAYVTINRPHAMNAMDPPTSAAMARVWQDFVADDSLLVGILTGAGDKAFCAGADLKYRLEHPEYSPGRGEHSFAQQFGGIVRGLIPKPIVAAINGYCLGGGMELALACDVAVASETATFGLPEVLNAGTVPGSGGTLRIPRQVPLKIAMWMLLSGERMSAAEAYRVGLVNRVVPAGELMKEATRMAQLIAQNRTAAVRQAKEIALRSLDRSLLEPFDAWDLYDLIPAGEAENQAQLDARRAFFARVAAASGKSS